MNIYSCNVNSDYLCSCKNNLFFGHQCLNMNLIIAANKWLNWVTKYTHRASKPSFICQHTIYIHYDSCLDCDMTHFEIECKSCAQSILDFRFLIS